jgi:uncharacterized protein YndB with AHSA1/START domain
MKRDATYRLIGREQRPREAEVTNTRDGDRILGSLHASGGKVAVRMEDHIEAGIAEVWSALTDPQRLADWLGEFEGDLRLGGEYRTRYFASGWEGTGRVEAFEPERHLLVLTKDADDPAAAYDTRHAFEVTLTADGDATDILWEERGMPADLLAPYGAGIQVHVEDLASYLAGGERCDANVRFEELLPAYQVLAAGVSEA